MALRIYLVPVLHIPFEGGGWYNVPACFQHRLNPAALPELADVRYAWETWLNEEFGILVADVTDAQHALVDGQPDVVAVPPLDEAISAGARNRIRQVLETGHVPGLWVQTGMTYREVLRIVLGMFRLHNRALARTTRRRFFDGTATLDLTIGQLPADIRTALADAASDLGLDYSAVTPDTTLRQALKQAADRLAGQPFTIGGLVI